MQLSILWLLAVVVLVFRALQFVALTKEIQWGYDFSAYWVASRLLLEGIAPYAPWQLAGPYSPQQQFLYLYPPALAAVVASLGSWIVGSYRAAAWVWTGLAAYILIVAVLATARAERLGDRFPFLAGKNRWLLLAAAFAFPPVIGELVLGNVHLLLLGLLTFAWLGLRRGDGRGEWLAGVGVGVAAVIKVFPALLLLWFILRRQFKAAAGVLVGAAAFALVTLPITGIEPWLQYPTVLGNLAAPTDTTDTLAPTVWLSQVAGFTAARILVTLAGVAILAWAALRLDATRSFAVAVVISVLIAPAVYHHYLALLVLPLILGLSAGVPLPWLALAYFLMWGGQQQALGDFAWIVNRGMPTSGTVILLVGLLLGGSGVPAASRTTAEARAPA